MKKTLFALFVISLFSLNAHAAQQTILGGSSVYWGDEKVKINANFTELYGLINLEPFVWDSSTSYADGEMVYYDQALWVALQATSVGVAPSEGAQWTAAIDVTLTDEEVQDKAGAMVSGNTETLITVTYQDADGTIDFVVDEASIDHDALTNFVSGEHFTMLDEDDMATDSNTQAASQQSIKAYVDTSIATRQPDLTFGNGIAESPTNTISADTTYLNNNLSFQSILSNAAGLYAALSDVTKFYEPGDTIQIGSGTTLPATCTVGQIYIDTDADTDGELYICRATDTWKAVDDDGGAGGSTTMTDFDGTAWRFFYTNGSGDVVELALGADGTYLMSNGASVAPSFETPAGGGASEMSDLTDVGVTTKTNRFVLVADGDSFEARLLTEADISDLGTYETADSAIAKTDEAETITANWVNTSNPWAVNEGGTGVSTLAALAAALDGEDWTFTGAVDLTSASSVNMGPLSFEGATADAYETTFTITDPTADRTVTFGNFDMQIPADSAVNADGTIALADEADALSSNPTNCSAGNYPLGIDANGNVESCTSASGGGDALTTNPLSQFAATTSAQLRGVLSDESGTGVAYFQGGNLGTPSGGSAANLTSFPTLNQSTTGNSATATAFASNPTDCSAGEYPTSIDTGGNFGGCTDAGTEISSAITTERSATATLTNKTIDGDDNTLQDIPSDALGSLSESTVLAEPDQLQPISDAWMVKYFPAETYPSGVTIDAIHITTSATCTDALNFEEWTQSGTSASSTVEAITLSGTFTEDDGTLADGSIAADGRLMVDLPASPTDIAFYEITVVYHAN